jgi:membrane-associated HD superfamily phosphohydrolase
MTKTNLPVLTFAGFLLVPSSGPMAAFLVESFDVMMIYFFTDAPSGYMVYLLIQAVTGITFAFLFKEKLRRREKNVALVLSFFSYIGILFFLKAYTLYHKISLELVLSVFIGDIIFTLFVDFIYPYIVKTFSSERDKVYREIMSKNYPLRREIRDFSKFEYDHALKVSYFAGKCAFETGCSISTAKAGGLYYRFPKLFDKDVNSEALKILEDHCFPMEVMDIIYEYGGEFRKPSSPESAIVHMVDAVITRIEILDEETMKSSWNQDMVIYSILNDLSGKGMYDQSQLSLNQYLKIRDYLVNANLLINIEED